MVPVFLLYVDRQRRLCPPQSDRDQASRARHDEGHRHLRRQAGWVAQRLVDRGLTTRYNYVRQGLEDVSYRAWRDYDAEDAVRFWALRERELGMIKSSPDTIIAKGADWRFVKDVRKELGI